MRAVSILLIFLALGLTSCEIVGDIFQAGVWVGVLIVVGIIALIAFLIAKARGRK